LIGLWVFGGVICYVGRSMAAVEEAAAVEEIVSIVAVSVIL
jgi:hypothetical protein